MLREVSRIHVACLHALNWDELRWIECCNISRNFERTRQPERSWDTSVGQAIRLRSDRPRNRCSIPGNGKIFFFSPVCPDRLWASCSLDTGGGGRLPGIKQPGCEGYRSPLTSAEFKNEWSYTTTPHACPHGVYRDKVFIIFTQKFTEWIALLLRKWEV